MNCHKAAARRGASAHRHEEVPVLPFLGHEAVHVRGQLVLGRGERRAAEGTGARGTWARHLGVTLPALWGSARQGTAPPDVRMWAPWKRRGGAFSRLPRKDLPGERAGIPREGGAHGPAAGCSVGVKRGRGLNFIATFV